MGAERALHLVTGDVGGFDGLLHVHAELDDVQEELHQVLVLTIAALNSKGQVRLAVLEPLPTDGGFTGEYTRADGSVHRYTTEPMTAEVAGVFRTGEDAAAEGIVALWIVDNDGEERGAVFQRGRQTRDGGKKKTIYLQAGRSFAVSRTVGG